MKQKLPKELEKLLEFFLEQRRNPPAENAYSAAIVNRPEVFTVNDLQAHLNNPLLQPEGLDLVVGVKKTPLDSACHYKLMQRKELKFIDETFIDQQLAQGAAVVLEGLDILDARISALLARVDETFPCAMSNCVAFFSQHDNEAWQGHRPRGSNPEYRKDHGPGRSPLPE